MNYYFMTSCFTSLAGQYTYSIRPLPPPPIKNRKKKKRKSFIICVSTVITKIAFMLSKALTRYNSFLFKVFTLFVVNSYIPIYIDGLL